MSRKDVWLFFAVALLGSMTTSATAELSPIVYYTFDDLTNTIVDESGKDYDGTPNGSLQLDELGYLDGCFRFNGSDTYVELTRPIQDSFTLAAWIKTDTTGSSGSAAYEGDGLFWSDVGGTANDFVAAVLGDNFAFFAGNPDTSVTSNAEVTTGEWVHVTAVRDLDAGMLSIYVNGEFDNSVEHSNADALDAQKVLAIGANTLDSRFYTGLMDEVKIFDVALPEEDMEEVMQAGLGLLKAIRPNPENEETDILRDTVLAWSPSDYAVAHNVYLGTSFDDVNGVDTTNAPGVLISQGQTAATCDPGRLEFR